MFRSRAAKDDEDIHSFISRRLGPEVASLLIDPVVRGIYAGDCRKLSVKSCFRPLFTLEQEHGSIVRGMLTEAIRKRLGSTPRRSLSKLEQSRVISYRKKSDSGYSTHDNRQCTREAREGGGLGDLVVEGRHR